MPGPSFDPSLVDPRILTALGMSSPTPAPSMSLWDEMQQKVAPAPTDGLLSEQDVKAARGQGLLGFGASLLQQSGPTTQKVGFGQALGGALQQGLGAYQGALEQRRQAVGQKQAFDANKLKIAAMQQDTARTAAAQKARAAVFAQFPPPADNKDPQAVSDWIDHVTPALVAAQDFDGAEKLTNLRKAMADKDRFQAVQAGDAIYTFDPKTGQYTRGPDRGVPADQIEMKRLQLGEQRARTSAMQEVATERQATALSNAFQTHNKDLVARALPINQGLLSIREAQNNPALYKTAIASFVQAADQKAQLRSQMLAYFSQLDPSLHGQWETLRSRILSGKLPAYQSAQLVQHLEALRTQTAREWDRRRAGEVKRHPALDGYLPQSDEIFNDEAGAPAQQQPSLDSLWGGQ